MSIEEADTAVDEADVRASAVTAARVSAAAAPARRLVIVSNRVAPIGRNKLGQGGLAIALRAALERNGGIWFGYSGSISERPSETPKLTTDGNITAALLDLSRRDYDEYYIGYANRVLWPLFHYRPSLVGFSRRDFAGYMRVNRNFARALAPMLLPEDLVWVHDYHLIPLGEALRQLDCRQPIGFFLPWIWRAFAITCCARAAARISAAAGCAPSGGPFEPAYFRSGSTSRRSRGRRRRPKNPGRCGGSPTASATAR
jgi:hypothetical protein